MKKVQIIPVFVFIALMLTAGSSYAQRGKRANRSSRNLDCYRNIPNLTEKQNQQIQTYRAAHLKQVAQLREERRSAADWDKKSAIRRQMLAKQQAHRDEIRALLTEEQKTYFDKNYRRYSNASFRGKGRGGSGRRGNANSTNAKGGGNRRW